MSIKKSALEIIWTWDFVEDLSLIDGGYRQVMYLLPNADAPQILTSPEPHPPAKWGIPSIDGIEAERAIVSEVVNMFFVAGFGSYVPKDVINPIRYVESKLFSLYWRGQKKDT